MEQFQRFQRSIDSAGHTQVFESPTWFQLDDKRFNWSKHWKVTFYLI